MRRRGLVTARSKRQLAHSGCNYIVGLRDRLVLVGLYFFSSERCFPILCCAVFCYSVLCFAVILYKLQSRQDDMIVGRSVPSCKEMMTLKTAGK